MTERYERIRKLLDERDALREALEDIRSRSSINLAMRPDPVALTSELGNMHQISDAALSNGEAEMTDRLMTTHGHDCWGWGPKHYECAVRRVERLEEALRELVDLKDNVKHSFPNDYAVRKPLAWDKARALLRDQEEGNGQ